MNTYLIGAGGVGSWLAPLLVRRIKPVDLWVVDGDRVETKNLDRQLFTTSDVGKNKAHVLALRLAHGANYLDRFYSTGMVRHDEDETLLVAVDNHPARRAALSAADMDGCNVIIGANETYSAEAYYYTPKWRATKLDPRVYYPELNTGTANDPRARAAGCTGEAQDERPQLAQTNFMVAALMMKLFALWVLDRDRYEEEAIPYLPHHLVSNETKLFSTSKADVEKPVPADAPSEQQEKGQNE